MPTLAGDLRHRAPPLWHAEPVTGQRVPAPLLVVMAIASVQTGSAVARTLFDDLGVSGTALLRLVIAATVLLVLLRPPLRSWTRRQWLAALVLGVALAGMNLVFYLSLDLVPLGVAVTVEFTGPLLLALVQTRRWVDLMWALVAAGGVALLGSQAATGDIAVMGLVLAFVAGLFWALYIVSSARVGRVVPGVDGLAVALAIAALLVLPFGASGAVGVVDAPGALALVTLVALLSSVIPYGFELLALRRMSTRVFGVLMSLQPGAAALSGWVILGQSLGAVELTALAMVTVASAGITLASRPDHRADEPLVGPVG